LIIVVEVTGQEAKVTEVIPASKKIIFIANHLGNKW